VKARIAIITPAAEGERSIATIAISVASDRPKA
jgi:hypothetical protein